MWFQFDCTIDLYKIAVKSLFWMQTILSHLIGSDEKSTSVTCLVQTETNSIIFKQSNQENR